MEQTTQEDIVQGFAQEAIRRGTQASNTPFMQRPLVGCFGFRGSSPVVTAVLLEAHLFSLLEPMVRETETLSSLIPT